MTKKTRFEGIQLWLKHIVMGAPTSEDARKAKITNVRIGIGSLE